MLRVLLPLGGVPGRVLSSAVVAILRRVSRKTIGSVSSSG